MQEQNLGKPQNNSVKRSALGTTALVISIIVFVSAVIIFFTEYFNLQESHPLASLFFIIVLISTIPEFPLLQVSQSLGFPIILPAVVFAIVVFNFLKGNSRKKFSIIAVSLTVIAILLFLSVRFLLNT